MLLGHREFTVQFREMNEEEETFRHGKFHFVSWEENKDAEGSVVSQKLCYFPCL